MVVCIWVLNQKYWYPKMDGEKPGQSMCISTHEIHVGYVYLHYEDIWVLNQKIGGFYPQNGW